MLGRKNLNALISLKMNLPSPGTLYSSILNKAVQSVLGTKHRRNCPTKLSEMKFNAGELINQLEKEEFSDRKVKKRQRTVKKVEN